MYKISIGQMVDRLTIVIRKRHYCENKDELNEEIVNLLYEINVLIFQHIEKQPKEPCSLISQLLLKLMELMAFNSDIWNLESDIRKAKDDDLGMREIGRRAIKIREINNERISCVNAINHIAEQITGQKVAKETKYVE